MNTLQTIVNLKQHPISDPDYQQACKTQLDRDGVLVLPDFYSAQAIAQTRQEGLDKQHLAWFCQQQHNVFLTPADNDYPMSHPRNREVISSKGCITDDQIADDSPLRTLYNAEAFQTFLCRVLGEQQLHPYADPLSSINLHYARAGQELGWHFDNSAFAITLLIQQPEAGGHFEYVRDVRDAAHQDMNFAGVADILEGKTPTQTLNMPAGTLVLFRGRNSLHRVTPVQGEITRLLVVLAYNSEPGVSLSESARLTFYGRLN